MCGVYPDADVGSIGDEISSTYEGRHVTLLASELSHSNALAVVTKGYPVWWGNAVGVAFKTEVLGTDLIAVDTEGIWIQDVFAQNDAGPSAVVPGNALYINTTTGLISKITNEATQLPFGYALGSVDAGNTDTIAVKVHWDPLTPEVVAFAGAVSVGGTFNVAGVTTLAGITIITAALYLGAGMTVTGLAAFNSGIGVAGGINITGATICGGGLSVAGQTDLQIVYIHSELFAGGIMHIPDNTDATLLPGADPAVAGRLWSNAGVITRSAG
jgi:hypothetical protein